VSQTSALALAITVSLVLSTIVAVVMTEPLCGALKQRFW
jgi:hypothetical protein